MTKGLFPIGSHVRGKDDRLGIVRAVSKDGGRYRFVAWEDGSESPAPVEDLRPPA